MCVGERGAERRRKKEGRIKGVRDMRRERRQRGVGLVRRKEAKRVGRVRRKEENDKREERCEMKKKTG